MSMNTEQRKEEIFNELQARQAALAKKVLLGTFVGMGFAFAVLGTAFIISGDILWNIGLVFLPFGLACIALGIILYFAIPTKYSYEKHKQRVQKYGYTSMADVSAKIAELEARIEDLEKKQ